MARKMTLHSWGLNALLPLLCLHACGGSVTDGTPTALLLEGATSPAHLTLLRTRGQEKNLVVFLAGVSQGLADHPQGPPGLYDVGAEKSVSH